MKSQIFVLQAMLMLSSFAGLYIRNRFHNRPEQYSGRVGDGRDVWGRP